MKKYKRAYIEITNICNLDCCFCPKTKRKPMYMDVSSFEKILSQVSRFTEYICLHLMGEPSLHPQLDEILDLCEKYKMKVIFTTNGTLIEKTGKLLLKSKAVYKTVFSLHSFEANENGFEIKDYLDRIIDFAKSANENTEIITALRLWNLDGNTVKGKNSMNSEIFDYIENSFNKSIKNNDRTSRDIKLADHIFLQTASRFEWPDSKRDILSERVYCHALKDHFGILCDGTVVACCLDNEGEINLGNCLSNPLEEILKCERAERISHGFSDRKAHEELCKRCEYVTRF